MAGGVAAQGDGAQGEAMKTAVVYLSQTGQTKKVAEAIARGVEGSVDVRQMSDVESLNTYDLVFFGMPIHGFGAPKGVRDFLAQTCSGKKLALFVTHAAPEDLDPLAEWLENCKAAAACTDLVGFFHCQGELAEPIRQYMLASDNQMLQEFAQMGELTKGQPDETRLRQATEFGGEVARTLWRST
jgi:flavodoxin